MKTKLSLFLVLFLGVKFANAQVPNQQDPVVIEHPPILESWGKADREDNSQGSFLTPDEVREIQDWARDSLRDLETLKVDLERLPIDRQRNEFLSRVNKIIRNSGGLRVETLMRLALTRTVELDRALVAYSDQFQENGFSVNHLQFLKDLLDESLLVAHKELGFFEAQKSVTVVGGVEKDSIEFTNKPSRAAAFLEFSKILRGYASRVFVLNAKAQYEVMVLSAAYLELDLHRDKDKMKFAWEINFLHEKLSELPKGGPMSDPESVWLTQGLFVRLNEVIQAIETKIDQSEFGKRKRFVRMPRQNLENIKLVKGLILLKEAQGPNAVFKKLHEIYARKDFENFGDDWYLAALHFGVQSYSLGLESLELRTQLFEKIVSEEKGTVVFPSEILRTILPGLQSLFESVGQKSQKGSSSVDKTYPELLARFLFENFNQKNLAREIVLLNRVANSVSRKAILERFFQFYVSNFNNGRRLSLEPLIDFVEGGAGPVDNIAILNRLLDLNLEKLKNVENSESLCNFLLEIKKRIALSEIR